MSKLDPILKITAKALCVKCKFAWFKNTSIAAATRQVAAQWREKAQQIVCELNQKKRSKRTLRIANDHDVRVSTAANIASDDRPGDGLYLFVFFVSTRACTHTPFYRERAQ